jgi:hypothetical protein
MPDQITLTPAPTRANGPGRRPSPSSWNLETTCHPLTDGKTEVHWPTRILEVSTSKISLILDQRLEPGAVLSIELHNTTRSVVHRMFVRVMHVRIHPNGKWILGGVFAHKLRDEELRALLT